MACSVAPWRRPPIRPTPPRCVPRADAGRVSAWRPSSPIRSSSRRAPRCPRRSCRLKPPATWWHCARSSTVANDRLAARTVLVTGANGFTGGHLARRLIDAGHRVRALVRPGANAEGLRKAGIEVFCGQLTDAKDVRNAAAGCERIYHIAAAFRTAGHPDQYYYDVNVGGTRNVLDAAQSAGCERVVHCST